MRQGLFLDHRKCRETLDLEANARQHKLFFEAPLLLFQDQVEAVHADTATLSLISFIVAAQQVFKWVDLPPTLTNIISDFLWLSDLFWLVRGLNSPSYLLFLSHVMAFILLETTEITLLGRCGLMHVIQPPEKAWLRTQAFTRAM